MAKKSGKLTCRALVERTGKRCKNKVVKNGFCSKHAKGGYIKWFKV